MTHEPPEPTTDAPPPLGEQPAAPAPQPATPAAEPFQPEPEVSTDQVAEERSAPSLRDRVLSVPILLGAVSVLGVIAILLGLMVFAPGAAPIKLGIARTVAESDEIESVARRFARNFLTIDYQSLDADFDRVLADSTGAFRDKIENLLQVVGDLLVKAKSVSVGRVDDVAVVSRRDDTAMVSARVSRTITNARRQDARPTQHTLLITLVRTASEWKVDDLSEVPGSARVGDLAPR